MDRGIQSILPAGAGLGGDVDAGVPVDAACRARLWQAVQDYVLCHGLQPPLGVEEIGGHLAPLLGLAPEGRDYPRFMLVLLGNAVWHGTVAAIPFERRVLMLPECLRHPQDCEGVRDELGLLCAQCGRCAVGRIQKRAEQLGYVILVAEGTTVVRRLLQSGKVDAVVGVGCLASLERIFPDMSAHAVPGLGIPLLADGCSATCVDEGWLSALLEARTSRCGHIDMDALRRDVSAWFAPEVVADVLGTPRSDVAVLGQAWLCGAGKRWRPTLVAAVYRALKGAEARLSDVQTVGVAVESFHKASLAHDDIEDGDAQRDELPALHARYGVPRALNVGDFLLGEGYRLLSHWPGPADQVVRLVRVAARGHRSLSVGQGDELAWSAAPHALTLNRLLEFFARKTSPSFDVALVSGAICADASAETCDVLTEFSRALGIAYQIRDDLADTEGSNGVLGDVAALRPCLPLALACESTDPEVASSLARLWTGSAERTGVARDLVAALERSGDMDRGRQWLAHYRQKAGRMLSQLDHDGLRRVLRRFVNRILGT